MRIEGADRENLCHDSNENKTIIILMKVSNKTIDDNNSLITVYTTRHPFYSLTILLVTFLLFASIKIGEKLFSIPVSIDTLR